MSKQKTINVINIEKGRIANQSYFARGLSSYLNNKDKHHETIVKKS